MRNKNKGIGKLFEDAKVNLDFIDKYNKELLKEKKKPDGWKKIIDHEKIEYEMHLKFANILIESD